MTRPDPDPPEWFLNRELSWLEFNDRVLQQGLAKELPLLERLKFLAIVSSNLDEFFMIRVAGLAQQRAAGARRRDPSGLTPVQQLERIGARMRRMVADQSAGLAEVLAGLRAHGLALLDADEWSPRQREFVRQHFAQEILPVLTPLAIQELKPPPLLSGLQLHAAAVLAGSKRGSFRIVVVPQAGQRGRFLTLPADAGMQFARAEDVTLANLEQLFPESKILGTGLFRITRDADVSIQDDEGGDLLQTVESALLARRRRNPVRLEVSRTTDPRIRAWLMEWLGLTPQEVYEPVMLDAGSLMELVGLRGLEALRHADWHPQPPQDLLGCEDLWEALRARDILLFHPYEQFDPVIGLLQQAADDPSVLAIKQTLYRTSGDSPIINALERAGRNGKRVTVLVELKARFDEARNVEWARRLEDAGCHVLYGVAGYKTHAKALLVVRREPDRIRRYVHLATGNYNDRTARLYSDVGLLSSQPDLAGDVAAFFNLLTGASEAVGWSSLAIAPTDLRRRCTELIDREIQASTPDRPGLIMAKTNSLEDPAICRALYRASQGGVKILLNVRGICCLRPGVPGLSETIEVRSIVDRYLEHARIFYFRNGGHEEVYLSSADWMGRNLDRRLELMFPVTSPPLVRRLIGILEALFADNVQAWRLGSDGTYQRVRGPGSPVRAQEKFYTEALTIARTAQQGVPRFRPLAHPEE